jgi:hypothetical protein
MSFGCQRQRTPHILEPEKKSVEKNTELAEDVCKKTREWHRFLAYRTNITGYFNCLNLRLEKKTAVTTYSILYRHSMAN